MTANGHRRNSGGKEDVEFSAFDSYAAGCRPGRGSGNMILLRYIHSYTAYLLVGCLFVIVILFGLIPYHVLRLLGMQKSARRWLNVHVKLISRGIFFCIGAKVDVYGLENLPALDEEGRSEEK